ncbi:MAG: HAMP domain-containing protein, partial [Lachnospiraceae bacterium]|nr:HAMP domain-containing protein [Lachnospiraceae bacterium]
MKIHTRMVITFLAVALVPLVMMVIVFCLLRLSLDASRSDGIQFGGNMEQIIARVDELYLDICARIEEDPSCMEDRPYLQDVSAELSSMSATLVIRKGGELYFTGNSRMSGEAWDRLPEYGSDTSGSDSGIYFGDLEEYVKQYDFVFPEGSKGTLFILVNMNTVTNRKLTVDMFVSMILILLITALLVTFWNKKGMLDPMSELSKGLTQVREGNFDYVIEHTGERGEVGELFRNYEDMRMRLRENEERSAEQEKKNRELISNISHDLKTPIT